MTAMPEIAGGMTLRELLAGLASVSPSHDRFVTGLALDSRRVVPGDLFLAVQGSRDHGSVHAGAAAAAGAAAVVQSAAVTAGTIGEGVPVIYLPGLEQRVGDLADRFYGHPSRHVWVTGVTGTNGKTSVCHFVAQALTAAGRPCGIMGTLGRGLYGRLEPAVNTTPDAVTVQRTLAEWRRRGVGHGIMEVSSHGLVQGRVAGVTFASAVFTNLGRDHLDYHGSLEAYAAAKGALFRMPGLGAAILNLDDAEGARLAGRLAADLETLTFSLAGRTDAHLRVIESRFHGAGMELGIQTPEGVVRLSSGLAGRFQAANLLAALGVLMRAGMAAGEAAARLGEAASLPGRFERFGGGGAPTVIVDYAHTPDALEHALGEANALARGGVTCVFGCGGERDRGKRPEMGAVAERLATRVILTDDNPRGEEPSRIIADILAGLRDPAAAEVVRDRAAAIARAIAEAGPGDVVVVAGKGHEGYQEVAGERLPFSDRTVVQTCLPEAAP